MEWPSPISFDGDFWMVTIRTMLSRVFVQRHEIYSYTLETIDCLISLVRQLILSKAYETDPNHKDCLSWI